MLKKVISICAVFILSIVPFSMLASAATVTNMFDKDSYKEGDTVTATVVPGTRSVEGMEIRFIITDGVMSDDGENSINIWSAFTAGTNCAFYETESTTSDNTQYTYAIPSGSSGKYLNAIVWYDGYSDNDYQILTTPISVGSSSTPAGLQGVSLSSDNPEVGKAITAKVTPDNPGVTLEYIWVRTTADDDSIWELGNRIEGANTNTYTPIADDVGKYITCLVFDVDSGYNISKDATASNKVIDTIADSTDNMAPKTGVDSSVSLIAMLLVLSAGMVITLKRKEVRS